MLCGDGVCRCSMPRGLGVVAHRLNLDSGECIENGGARVRRIVNRQEKTSRCTRGQNGDLDAQA
jgi:hypothetical protein